MKTFNLSMLIALLLFTFNTITEAKTQQKKVDIEILNDIQKKHLKTAYRTAQKDGLKKPLILSGIIMQESKAGLQKNFRTSKHKKMIDQTTGLGQIKVGTARDVIKRHPELKQKMSSNNLPHEIAYNDNFNIAVASLYLKDLSEECKSDASLIAAYNSGHCSRGKKPYVKAVLKQMGNIKNQIL
jgi:hypothetical protein